MLGKNTALVGGKPLVCWAIERALEASLVKEVIVSTNDPVVEGIVQSRYAGERVSVHWRPPSLATDKATIDQLAAHFTADELMLPLAVLQPTTVPGRDVPHLDELLVDAAGSDADHLTVVTRTHEPVWYQVHPGEWFHLGERASRQDQAGLWREVGWRFHTAQYHAIGNQHHYRPISLPGTFVDIDTPEDVVAAEHELTRRTILFRPLCSERFGWGHLSRCMTIAARLQHHDIVWDTELVHDAGRERLRAAGWNTLSPNRPDVVVLDRLDTSAREVAQWVQRGVAVVTLEDEGTGASLADATINDMYRPHPERAGRHGYHYGERFVVLRSEFVGMPPYGVGEELEKVLVTFGGTDPLGLTERVSAWLDAAGLDVTVVVPPGREEVGRVHGKIVENPSMVREMARADLVVTSGGRTLYEAGAVGVPALAILQNEREARHVHLGVGNVNLGPGYLLDGARFTEVVRAMGDVAMRERLSDEASRGIDGRGVERVARIIEEVGR